MQACFACGNSCAISYCLSSSREYTMTRRGWWRESSVRTYCRPKEPVPPVMRMALSSNTLDRPRRARRRAFFHDAPAVEAVQPLAAGHGGKPVRDDDDRLGAL